MTYVWVALGGALGSVARFACSTATARWLGAAFPWGTLLVNVSGSFAIGLLAALLAADGRLLLGSDARAFLLVGVAYFLTAVVVPVVLIWVAGWDPTVKGVANFDRYGVRWGLWAGTMGAIGALCLIFALTAAGKAWGPLVVPPLVFAFAPIVNTIATLVYFHPVKTLPDWRFFAGLLLAIAGAAMVMVFKPTDPKPHAASSQTTAQTGIDPSVSP